MELIIVAIIRAIQYIVYFIFFTIDSIYIYISHILLRISNLDFHCKPICKFNASDKIKALLVFSNLTSNPTMMRAQRTIFRKHKIKFQPIFLLQYLTVTKHEFQLILGFEKMSTNMPHRSSHGRTCLFMSSIFSLCKSRKHI